MDKLRAQGWLELFTNTELGCSVSDLAEFYAICSITQGVVKSEVNRKKMCFKEVGRDTWCSSYWFRYLCPGGQDCS